MNMTLDMIREKWELRNEWLTSAKYLSLRFYLLFGFCYLIFIFSDILIYFFTFQFHCLNITNN